MAFNLEAVIRLRDKFSKPMKDAEKASDRFSRASERIKKVGKVAAGVAAGGVEALGAAAWKSADTHREAMRIIQVGTGATGEALDELVESYQKVGRTVPDDLAKVAEAMANLDTFTDATGSDLEDLTQQVLDVSRIMGEDAVGNSANFGKALSQFQRPAADAENLLNGMFKITQDYGIGFSELSSQLTGYGSVLKNAGFSMEDSAELFGRLHSTGLSVSRVMPGLNKAFRDWASAGKDPQVEFRNLVDEMMGAEEGTESFAKAVDIFGAEGVNRLVAGIDAGVFALDDLGQNFQNVDGLISDTATETMTFGERLARFRNQSSIALEPIGTGIMELVEKAFPALEWGVGLATDAFNWLRETGLSAFQSVRDAVVENFPELSNFSLSLSDIGDLLTGVFENAQPYINWFINDGIPAGVEVVRELYEQAMIMYQYIADNWTKIEPWVYGIVGAFTAYKVISMIVAGVVAVKTAAMTAFGVAVTLATSPIFLIAAAIGALIAIGVLLYKHWEKIKTTAVELWNKAMELWDSLGNLRYGFLMLLGPIGSIIGIGIAIWKNWDTIKEKAGELWSSLVDRFNNIRDSITEAMGNVRERLSEIWSNITETAGNAITGIIDFVKSIPKRIGEAIKRIKDAFLNVGKNIISGISEGFQNMLEKLPGPIKWVVEQLASGVTNAKKMGELVAGHFGWGSGGDDDTDGSHYHGLSRVPYDGYTAKLHKGERVLSADEAEEQDRGGGGGIVINVQNLNVRKESDIDAIAGALFTKIKTSWEAGA